VSKRARTRPAKQPAAPAAARPRKPRLFLVANAVFFVPACAAALLFEGGTGIVGLVLVGAAVLGAAWLGKRHGLEQAVAAAPAAAVAFALTAVLHAAMGRPPFDGSVLAGLAVLLETVLAFFRLAAAPPPAPSRSPTLARLGAALAQGRALRLSVTLALAIVAWRTATVAILTCDDAGFGWAAVAGLAASLVWLRAPRAGTILATLVFGAIPGLLVLGLSTEFGIWAPLSRPLCLGLGLAGPRPLVLLGLTASSGLLGLALWLADGAASRAESAPV
jgi:hypothetical protein